ncbi:MAG: insulinase family protein [Deltaproteobacteria bacterium]|nr:insulinase family protein [Deltaproteobacteria bacterium]
MISKHSSLDYSYSRRILPSGLTLVEVHQPHLHRGSISVLFRCGSRFESTNDNGLSHFLEHMVFRGTEHHTSAYELNLAVERLGGTLFAATSPDSTEFEMTLPSESLVSGAHLLAEVVTCPIFRDIEIERKIVAEEIREDLDEEGNPIDIDFLSRQRLWPGHPLGQSVIGPIDNALRFTVDDIQRHMTAHYVAKKTVVCISGAFDAETLLPIIEQEFSRIPDGDGEAPLVPPKHGAGPTIRHTHRPGSQTHVRIAFNALGGKDPDRIALAIMLGILDDGMSTRLHRRIFDELGLAYSVSADIEMYADAGALNIDASASHSNVAEIVKQIGRLLEDLRDRPITDSELHKAKQRELWGLETFLDDVSSMSGWYGEQELYWRPMRLHERMVRVDAIESADISRVASRVLSREHMHITTVGVLDEDAQKEVERAMHRNY